MRRHPARSLVVAALVCATWGPGSAANDATIVFDESAAIPGHPNVFNELFGNDINLAGSWVAHVRTAPSGFVIVKDGVAVVTQDEPVPGLGLVLDSAGTVGIDGLGRVVYRAVLDVGSGFIDAIVRDGEILLAEGDPVPGAFPPGTTYTFVDTAQVTESGVVYAGVRTSSGQDAFILLRAPEGGPVETRFLLVEGDVVDGSTVDDLWLGGAGPAFASYGQIANSAGSALVPVRLDPVLDGALWWDDDLIVVEGEPSLVPGIDWGSVSATDVALNEAGDIAYSWYVDSGTPLDRVLVKGRTVLARRGDPVPGLPETAMTWTETPRFDEQGRLFWMTYYDDPLAGSGAAILVDDQLVLHTGQREHGATGRVIVDIASDMSVTSDGSRVLAEIVFEGGEDALAFIEHDGAIVDLHGGLAGTLGTPRLDGWGLLGPEAPFDLLLTRSAPNAPVTLFVGSRVANQPFQGGILIPSPERVVAGLTTDADGAWTLSATWPAGLPSGFSAVVQAWVEDEGGPQGAAASNGLVFTQP